MLGLFLLHDCLEIRCVLLHNRLEFDGDVCGLASGVDVLQLGINSCRLLKLLNFCSLRVENGII